MRTRSILFAVGVLTMSLAPIISEQALASAQIYHWTTIAGLAGNDGSADGTNSDARFYSSVGVAVDADGNIYVGDWGNSTIRKIAPVGTNRVTTTIAGLAENDGSADGTNSTARFTLPHNVAVDANGNLYVADAGNDTIRKITPVGTNWVTTTIAGVAGLSGDDDGTNTDARFDFPAGIVLDGSGNLYVADTFNDTIRKITPVGTNWVTTTIAGEVGIDGDDDGTNTDAHFYDPYGISMDHANGNLYVVDSDNNTIRKIAPVGTNWVTTTIAGAAGEYGDNNGTNTDARFDFPTGIAVGGDGNLYVVDTDNSTIRKVTPVGTNWVVSTIGGLAGDPGTADGLNNQARFDSPFGLAVDADGNLYVADTGNNTIRLGVPRGTLTITKETAKLNFVKTGACSSSLTATLDLDAGYNLTNAPVSLDIGGADASFALDAKGKGKGVSSLGSCKLSYKKGTGPWTFTATLKNGSWLTQWGTYGLTNSTTPKAGLSVTLPVTLIIGDERFTGEKPLLYKAKAGKSGTAK